jgi:hypothetical protein
MRAALATSVSLIGFLVAWSPAAAQPAPPQVQEGERLVEKGLELRRQGKDEAALPYFRRAHELVGTPRSAAQLGFVEQALGRWADAEAHLALALAVPGDPWVSKNRGLIDESAGFVRRNLGSLDARANVPGALLIDGRVVGQLPLDRPLRLAAGKHQVELRAAGFAPTSREVLVSPGEIARVALQATPARAAGPLAALAPPPPSPTPVLAAAPGDAGPAAPPLHRRWWVWAAAAGAVAAGALALALTTSGPDPYPCGGAGRVCAR